MPAGNTYEAIATQTLGSDTTTVTFSSIPGTYTDLVLVMNYRSTRTNTYGYPKVNFNGDTGTNYSLTDLSGNGSSIGSGRTTNTTGFGLTEGMGNTAAANLFGQFNISIQNYSNSTTYKTLLSRGGSAVTGNSLAAQVCLWRSTSAITSIVITDNSGFNIMTGSSFSLYGIKAA
jgi:hypothetical protein